MPFMYTKFTRNDGWFLITNFLFYAFHGWNERDSFQVSMSYPLNLIWKISALSFCYLLKVRHYFLPLVSCYLCVGWAYRLYLISGWAYWLVWLIVICWRNIVIYFFYLNQNLLKFNCYTYVVHLEIYFIKSYIQAQPSHW